MLYSWACLHFVTKFPFQLHVKITKINYIPITGSQNINCKTVKSKYKIFNFYSCQNTAEQLSQQL